MKELILKIEVPVYLILFGIISFYEGHTLLGIVLTALSAMRYGINNMK
jgi:hypothetical protein